MSFGHCGADRACWQWRGIRWIVGRAVMSGYPPHLCSHMRDPPSSSNLVTLQAREPAERNSWPTAVVHANHRAAHHDPNHVSSLPHEDLDTCLINSPLTISALPPLVCAATIHLR